MSGVFPPLSCKEVKRALEHLGFRPRPRTGTSHEQWVKYSPDGKQMWKVTVTHRCAGDSVSVAVALEKLNDGDYYLVVTVMK